MVYAVANLHGNYSKFIQLLRTLKFRDTDVMYVLGDLVDYGDEPMELIGDLSVRYNIYPIVGEHDFRAAKMLIGFEKMLKSGNEKPTQSFINEMTAWMADGGQPTLDGYRSLDAEMREGIIDYLSDLSLYEETTVNGRKYLLVHAGISDFKPGINLEELSPESFFTEPLDLSRKYFDDTTVIVGHVSTADSFGGEGRIFHGNGSIDIDCGLKDGGRLGCLCLDNGQEFYI